MKIKHTTFIDNRGSYTPIDSKLIDINYFKSIFYYFN